MALFLLCLKLELADFCSAKLFTSASHHRNKKGVYLRQAIYRGLVNGVMRREMESGRVRLIR